MQIINKLKQTNICCQGSERNILSQSVSLFSKCYFFLTCAFFKPSVADDKSTIRLPHSNIFYPILNGFICGIKSHLSHILTSSKLEDWFHECNYSQNETTSLNLSNSCVIYASK